MEHHPTEPSMTEDQTVPAVDALPEQLLVRETVLNVDIKAIAEALLLGASEPLSLDRMLTGFPEAERPDRKRLRDALEQLQTEYTERVAEVKEVASGWRIQVREHYGRYLAQLQNEKPARYSRALLETLALIAYRQPITRGEVEDIRGVTLSPNIIRTLIERDWIKSVGVREVPGRPELLGTTKTFLDDFGLKALDSLPSLPEIRDLDALASSLNRLESEPPETEPDSVTGLATEEATLAESPRV